MENGGKIMTATTIKGKQSGIHETIIGNVLAEKVYCHNMT
jgi:hypothetical protein